MSAERTSWIFGHLLAGHRYQVMISAVNQDGEGPISVENVETPAIENCK